MYVIYDYFSVLIDQTSLPPNQPTGLKLKNMHNLGIFLPILLKFGMQTVNGGTHHMNVIDQDFSMLICKPPTSLPAFKWKASINLGIFLLILLKFGMQSVNGGTHHMNVIDKDFSMLTGKPPTSLPAYKWKASITLAFFHQFGWNPFMSWWNLKRNVSFQLNKKSIHHISPN